MTVEAPGRPELGPPHHRLQFSLRSPWVVQYWESFEKLEASARANDSAHLPA